MYKLPVPFAMPIPIPIPVPIFIPTTRNSAKGIMKQIKVSHLYQMGLKHDSGFPVQRGFPRVNFREKCVSDPKKAFLTSKKRVKVVVIKSVEMKVCESRIVCSSA